MKIPYWIVIAALLAIAGAIAFHEAGRECATSEAKVTTTNRESVK